MRREKDLLTDPRSMRWPKHAGFFFPAPDPADEVDYQLARFIWEVDVWREKAWPIDGPMVVSGSLVDHVPPGTVISLPYQWPADNADPDMIDWVVTKVEKSHRLAGNRTWVWWTVRLKRPVDGGDVLTGSWSERELEHVVYQEGHLWPFWPHFTYSADYSKLTMVRRAPIARVGGRAAPELLEALRLNQQELAL